MCTFPVMGNYMINLFITEMGVTKNSYVLFKNYEQFSIHNLILHLMMQFKVISIMFNSYSKVWGDEGDYIIFRASLCPSSYTKVYKQNNHIKWHNISTL